MKAILILSLFLALSACQDKPTTETSESATETNTSQPKPTQTPIPQPKPTQTPIPQPKPEPPATETSDCPANIEQFINCFLEDSKLSRADECMNASSTIAVDDFSEEQRQNCHKELLKHIEQSK